MVLSSFQSNHFPDLSSEILLPSYTGKTIYENKSRYYMTDDGRHKLPSISTVMGYDPEKENKLAAWRNRIGEDKAKAITKRSSDYGTLMHDCLLHYLSNDMDALNKEISGRPKTSLYTPLFMFNVIKAFCDKNVEGIYHQESPVYSTKLGIAGRFDVLCKMNNEPVIMDFKNSLRPKKSEWVDGYRLQSTSYASIITEHTGIEIKHFVIPVVSFSGDLQVFTGRVADHYKDMKAQIRKYYRDVLGKV